MQLRSHLLSSSLVRAGALLAWSLSPLAVTAQCTQWSALQSGVNNTVFAVQTLANGDLACGGAFTFAGGGAASRVARWNGTSWSALGSGVDNHVRAVTGLPNGDLIAAGDFANAGGAPASRIARWNGSAWSPLGSGISSTNLFGLYALATLHNGDVVAAGYFQSAGGVAANAIARWDGSAWSPLGSGMLGTVFALTVLPNGDLVAGGNFGSAGGVTASRVARWNGSTWAPFGSGIGGFRVNALAVLPNGDLVVGGNFTTAGGTPASSIARWNGSSWSSLGTGMNGDVLALAALPDGDLLAGGQFTTAGGVAAVGGARWNGSTWSAIGFTGGAQVYAIAGGAESARTFGGFFTSVGGVGASLVARLASTCPATAVDTAAGCVGSGGANTLAAVTAPWIGTTYRARGTGLPATCIAAVVTGFGTANVPLAPLLPPAGASCSLLVTLDILGTALPSGGVLDTDLVLPDDSQLIGLVVHQQMVLFEVDPGTFAFVDTSASNRLTATIGAF